MKLTEEQIKKGWKLYFDCSPEEGRFIEIGNICIDVDNTGVYEETWHVFINRASTFLRIEPGFTSQETAMAAAELLADAIAKINGIVKQQGEPS